MIVLESNTGPEAKSNAGGNTGNYTGNNIEALFSPIAIKPKHITANRAAGLLHVEWADGHNSRFSLEWLRANCPCATCREERNKASSDPLRLMTGPLPSAQLTGAEFVGNYAIRLDWADGHNSGIYPFKALRRSCPCMACNPDGAPALLPD